MNNRGNEEVLQNTSSGPEYNHGLCVIDYLFCHTVKRKGLNVYWFDFESLQFPSPCVSVILHHDF